jgi:hypothetical protein
VNPHPINASVKMARRYRSPRPVCLLGSGGAGFRYMHGPVVSRSHLMVLCPVTCLERCHVDFRYSLLLWWADQFHQNYSRASALAKFGGDMVPGLALFGTKKLVARQTPLSAICLSKFDRLKVAHGRLPMRGGKCAPPTHAVDASVSSDCGVPHRAKHRSARWQDNLWCLPRFSACSLRTILCRPSERSRQPHLPSKPGIALGAWPVPFSPP